MERRFEWLLSGKESGPDPYVDIDLWNDRSVGVVPTRGSLVAGWLLVIPRVPVLCIAALQPSERKVVLEAGVTAATQVRDLGKHIYFFEHGTFRAGTNLGCGVDQAHLHVVPGNFDLFSCLLDRTVAWAAVSADDPWDGAEDDYYLIGRAGLWYRGTPRERVSQYFRRRIAAETGQAHAWDYREWPHYDKVRRTLEHFSGFAGGSRAEAA